MKFNSMLHLQVREIEYSCSPGGIDTWELYSTSENLIYSSENLDDIMKYIFKNFGERRINLEIRSLEWWNKLNEEIAKEEEGK